MDHQELISAYLDGLASQAQLSELGDWLAADTEHLRQFARQSLLHSQLRDQLKQEDLQEFFLDVDPMSGVMPWVDPQNILKMLQEEFERKRLLEEEFERKRLLEEESLRLQSKQVHGRPTVERVVNKPVTSPNSMSRVLAGSAIAATLLFFFVFSRPLEQEPEVPQVADVEKTKVPKTVVEQKPIEVAPVYIATITDALSSAATAHESTQTYPIGTRLEAGPLKLEHGITELQFESGVRLLVEAPAEMVLKSANRIRLTQGRVVARVPESAIGFTVLSDAATFIDLGTEFGVKIDQHGDADIHVLEGEVALAPNVATQQEPTQAVLRHGTARSISADGSVVKEIEYSQTAFIREVPQSRFELAILQSRPLHFWRLNESAGSQQTESLGSQSSLATVGSGVLLGRRTGQKGTNSEDNTNATFGGVHAGIDTGANGRLPFTSGFTLESWIRPTEAVDTAQRFISTFDDKPTSGFAFGIAGRGFPNLHFPRKNAPAVTLGFTFYGVYDLVSKAEVPLGEWSHVALVVDDQGAPTMFLNGRQIDTLMRDTKMKTFSELPSDWNTELRGIVSNKSCFLGRNPVSADANFPHQAWQGDIDEVVVFNRPLSAEEILRHFEASTDTVDENLTALK